MAAYANDTSEEARAKLQQLTVQLQDAEESRSDTEYQRHLEDQQAILDRMYQSLEDYFNDKLEDSDAILNEAKNLVRDNLPSVKNTLDSSLTFSKQATAHITETMDNVLNTDIKNIKGSTAVVDGNVSLIKDSVLKTMPELEAYYKQYADEQIKRTALYANVETLKDAANDFNTNLIALAAKFDKEVVTATKKSTASPTTSAISTIAGVKLQPVTSNVLGSKEFAKEYNTYMSQIYKNMTQRGMSLDSAINRVFALPQSVSYNMAINLDNVTDYKSFIDECKKNRSFENLIQTMTYNMMNNNSNSLKKYNT